MNANNDANGEGKQTNPKDLVGSRKVPLSTLPFRVLWRVGLAMLEGMVKYGRHNYRIAGVRASVYFDGLQRHIGAWWEGEDIDPDSGFHHIDKAIADLMVLRDSMLQGNWADDRPPSAQEDFPALHAEAARIVDLHRDKSPRHWTTRDGADRRKPEDDLGWAPWNGGSAPLLMPDRVVEVELRNGSKGEGSVADWVWKWDEDESIGDIVAYRLVK